MVDKVQLLGSNRQHRAKIEITQPIVVERIEQTEVLSRYAGLNRPRSLANPLEKHGDWGCQVDHQVGSRQGGHNQFIDVTIRLVIPLVEVTQVMKDAGKNMGILIDAAVSDGRLRQVRQRQMLLRAMTQEEHLQVERPLTHVGVEVCQIGIVGDGLETAHPAQTAAQTFSKRRLAHTDIACNQNKSFRHGETNCNDSCAGGNLWRVTGIAAIAVPVRTLYNTWVMILDPVIQPEIGEDTEQLAAIEPPFRVFIHNDDVTPYDFVVIVLQRFFDLTPLEAEQVTYAAHVSGLAYVTTLPKSEAEKRVGQAHFAAGLEGYPLTFTIEPE